MRFIGKLIAILDLGKAIKISKGSNWSVSFQLNHQRLFEVSVKLISRSRIGRERREGGRGRWDKLLLLWSRRGWQRLKKQHMEMKLFIMSFRSGLRIRKLGFLKETLPPPYWSWYWLAAGVQDFIYFPDVSVVQLKSGDKGSLFCVCPHKPYNFLT